MQDNNQQAAVIINFQLDRISNLPSLPVIVFDIIDSINNENISFDLLAKKIASDQAIVARILRVANSPFYGLSGKINSISRAITVIGINSLKTLVSAAGVINAFAKLPRHFNWLAFWQHSIEVAVYAKVLAQHLGQNTESAFVAGLLHDLGKLIIVSYFSDYFDQHNKDQYDLIGDFLVIEREKLGFDHAQLGGEIAKRWRFPPSIQLAIAEHHTLIECSQQADLVSLIATANQLANSQHLSNKEENILADSAILLHSRLGISPQYHQALFEQARTSYSGAIAIIAD